MATRSEEEVQLVHARLDWESAQLAESIAFEGALWQRALRRVVNRFSKRSSARSSSKAPTRAGPQEQGAGDQSVLS